MSMQKSTIVGLDIQPQHIHCVQLQKRRQGLYGLLQARFNFQQDIFAQGKIKNWRAFSLELNKFVKQFSLQGCIAAVSLPANLVRLQKIKMSADLNAKQIEETIVSQVKKDLPGMQDALCVDFINLPDSDKKEQNIFFAATRQAYLLQYVECLQEAGLEIKIIDVDLYALKRAALFADVNASPQMHAILFNQRGMWRLVLFKDEEIIFYQQWLHQMSDIEIVKALLNCSALMEEKHWDYFHMLCKPLQLPPQLQLKMKQLYVPEPFKHLQAEANFFDHETPAHEFLLAFGLALRKVPLC